MSVRNVLVLTGCVVAVGGAGILATTALGSTSVSPTQVATAPVVVDTNDPAGTAQLTVLTPVTFDSGGGQRVVAAGTQFVTSSSLLVDALPARVKPAVGDTLSCDLRIGVSSGAPVIDLVRCTPAKTSARG